MKLAVLGVGLIGGSLGLAARKRLGAEVIGWDRDGAVAGRAIERGAVDHAAATMHEAVRAAEIVVVAAPVGALVDAVGAALAAAPQGVVVTDVGSVKHPVVSAHAGDARFIGGHPLAGAEVAGVEHARADLFDDAPWYLTPGPVSDGVLFERLHRFLTAIGARPQAIDADVHDRVLAAVSHLPHILANTMVAQTTAALGSEETIPATGPSFRAATRVAGANPPMWADIYHANRGALGAQLDDAIGRLQRVRAILDDPAALEAWQGAIAVERQRLLESGLVGATTHELRVAVPNTPGVVAQVALTLGRAGINISDMALSPSPDNRTGVIALWCAGEHAARAAELVRGLGYPVTS